MKALNVVESGKVRYIGASSVSGCEAQTNTMNNTFKAYIRGFTNHGEVNGCMGVPDSAEHREKYGWHKFINIQTTTSE